MEATWLLHGPEDREVRRVVDDDPASSPGFPMKTSESTDVRSSLATSARAVVLVPSDDPGRRPPLLPPVAAKQPPRAAFGDEEVGGHARVETPFSPAGTWDSDTTS